MKRIIFQTTPRARVRPILDSLKPLGAAQHVQVVDDIHVILIPEANEKAALQALNARTDVEIAEHDLIRRRVFGESS